MIASIFFFLQCYVKEDIFAGKKQMYRITHTSPIEKEFVKLENWKKHVADYKRTWSRQKLAVAHFLTNFCHSLNLLFMPWIIHEIYKTGHLQSKNDK